MLTNEFERELMAALHGIQTALEAINATLAAQARSGPWTVTSEQSWTFADSTNDTPGEPR